MRYYHKVWLVMVFGWVANYMVRSGLSPVLIPIMDEFGLSYAQAGFLASAVFYSYTMMQLPAGNLGDRLGKKAILVVATLGWGVASLLTGLARSFLWLLAFRFLTGLAQGSYFSNDRPIIAAYTPPEKMGVGQGISFTGLINTVHFVGSLVAPWLTGFIKDVTLSFAGGAYLAALVTVVGALFFLAIRPSFRLGPERRIGESPAALSEGV